MRFGVPHILRRDEKVDEVGHAAAVEDLLLLGGEVVAQDADADSSLQMAKEIDGAGHGASRLAVGAAIEGGKRGRLVEGDGSSAPLDEAAKAQGASVGLGNAAGEDIGVASVQQAEVFELQIGEREGLKDDVSFGNSGEAGRGGVLLVEEGFVEVEENCADLSHG